MWVKYIGAFQGIDPLADSETTTTKCVSWIITWRRLTTLTTLKKVFQMMELVVLRIEVLLVLLRNAFLNFTGQKSELIKSNEFKHDVDNNMTSEQKSSINFFKDLLGPVGSLSCGFCTRPGQGAQIFIRRSQYI